MTRIDLATLAFRLLAVWLVLSNFTSIVAFASFAVVAGDDGPLAARTFILLVGAVVVIGPPLLLFVHAEKMALRTFPNEGELELPWSSGTVMRVGLALIGAWFAVTGLGQLVRSTAGWIDRGTLPFRWSLHELVVAAIQVVIGLALFLRGRGIALMWERFQDFGPHPPDIDGPS